MPAERLSVETERTGDRQGQRVILRRTSGNADAAEERALVDTVVPDHLDGSETLETITGIVFRAECGSTACHAVAHLGTRPSVRGGFDITSAWIVCDRLGCPLDDSGGGGGDESGDRHPRKPSPPSGEIGHEATFSQSVAR